MNIRKYIDYEEMYAALDRAMASEMEQMELYCTIGKAVSLRPEKGAAVAAANYLTERYPDAHGFSPRNVRRMRDFYRTYENHPALLTLACRSAGPRMWSSWKQTCPWNCVNSISGQ